MKNQGVVKIFTILFVMVCIFQLAFTFKARSVRSDAREFANGNPELERQYLDSIANVGVYDLLYKNFTYLEVAQRELGLGLDLQGGMSVMLEISEPNIVKALANGNKDPKFNAAIDTARTIQRNSTENFVEIFAREYAKLNPVMKLAQIFANDANDNQIKFTSTDEEVKEYLKREVAGSLSRTETILVSRIDQFGVTQPTVQRLENSGRILVELPGVTNSERVRKLLQSSAKLEFWECYSNTNNDGYKLLEGINLILRNQALLNDSTKTAPSAASTPDSSSATLTPVDAKNDITPADTSKVGSLTAVNDTQQTADSTNNDINPLFEVLGLNLNQERTQFMEGAILGYSSAKDTAKVNALLRNPEVQAYAMNARFMWSHKPMFDGSNFYALYAIKTKNGRPALEGDVIENAYEQVDDAGRFEIIMRMNTAGAKIWEKVTAAAVADPDNKKQIAVVLDNVVFSAPTVQSKIADGVSTISGNFTQEEAKDLANILKAGKLDAPAIIVQEAIVGPTLGKEAIKSGLISILLGFLGVILTMFLIYNNAGWVANIAVLFNLFFIVGVLASIQAALTLPGIAGIILNLGMAVDANVLINERVKDELKEGKNLKNAVANGYKYAATAIFDSNITTLIAGFVLLVYGSGPIYGFSVTLIIGIFCSLFTSFLLTRLIFEWLLKKDKNISFYFPYSKELLSNINFNFMGKKNMFFSVSGLVILAGIVSMFTKGFDYGVDFSGGWSYVVKFEKNVAGDQVREALASELDNSAPEVKTFGTNNSFKITTDYRINDNDTSVPTDVIARVTKGITKLDPSASIESSNKVSSSIAAALQRDAFIAVILAVAGMFLYILLRFRKWELALSTVIKLLHDVLVMMGLFSLLDGILPFALEIDQNFIAAVLTVIGYSINDSVVVLDRVREYMTERKGEKTSVLINDALNKTLSRTMLTSVATIIVVVLLLFFGGETIRGFSFALTVGIIVGSYSSLCIGGPLASILLDRKKENK